MCLRVLYKEKIVEETAQHVGLGGVPQLEQGVQEDVKVEWSERVALQDADEDPGCGAVSMAICGNRRTQHRGCMLPNAMREVMLENPKEAVAGDGAVLLG